MYLVKIRSAIRQYNPWGLYLSQDCPISCKFNQIQLSHDNQTISRISHLIEDMSHQRRHSKKILHTLVRIGFGHQKAEIHNHGQT